MMTQIALGFALILATIVVAGGGFVALEAGLARVQRWLLRPPHRLKAVTIFSASVLWILAIATAGVWLWAVVFLWLGIFPTLEDAVYFALVAFTTLGFGDVLLPQDWRLLSGMIAINGLIMIGMQTAMLIEVLRRTRAWQSEERDWDS